MTRTTTPGPRLARMARSLAIALAATLLAAFVLAGAGRAADLPRPGGAVVLTISGNIAHTNAPDRAEFDLDMLREIGLRSFSTSTMWTEGISEYHGVALHDVLRRVGASGTTVTAIALNDYSAELPMAEVAAEVPILAFLRDGRPMPVRDKGPLWVLYPYDSDRAFRTENIYSRSVWQLDRLHVD